MKIFVAGATGAIGRQLIPLLIAAGHEVTGTTRTTEKAAMLKQQGASVVVVDMFERANVIAAVRETQPDVVIHQLTDLGGRDFSANSRLRREGTRNLVDAARAAGTRRIIAQSIAWVTIPGDGPATEDVPLDIAAPAPRREMVEAVQVLENTVAELEHWIVLRYGILYGPGTWYAPDGLFANQVRQGQVSADESVTSFLHVRDAAQAALLALDWPNGIVNIVDDEPAPGIEWLPMYAETLGAPRPPVTSGRERAARGSANTKARQTLHWQPLYPGWREGFARAAREWQEQSARQS